MLRAWIWKETREQAGLLLGYAGFAGTLVLALRAALSPERVVGLSPEMLIDIVALTLAALGGLISGALVLTGDTESGTSAWLEGLPPARAARWCGKVSAAGLWTLAPALAVTLVLLLADGLDTRAHLLAYAPLAGWFGLSAGLVGGAGQRYPLPAMGVGLLVLSVAQVFGSASEWALDTADERWFRHPQAWGVAGTLLQVIQTGLLLALSWLLWTRSDWRGTNQKSAHWWQSYVALGWLFGRQYRPQVWALVGLAAVVGLTVPVFGWVWPWLGTTLLVGVILGAGVFGDERQLDMVRFYGDQRLPLGRVWSVQLGLRAVAASLALAAFAVTATVMSRCAVALAETDEAKRQVEALLRPNLWNDLLGQHTGYLFLPVGMGFGVGVVTALALRNPAVAWLAAGLVSSALVLWALLTAIIDGPNLWTWGVPLVVVLFGSVGLMRAWSSQRIGPSSAVPTLLLVGLGLVVAANVVPAWTVPEPQLPPAPPAHPLAEVYADRLKHALGLFAQQRDPLQEAPSDGVGGQEILAQRLQRGMVLRDGWHPDYEAKFGPWLEARFAQDWVSVLLDTDTPLPTDLRRADPGANVGDWLQQMVDTLKVQTQRSWAKGDPDTGLRLTQALFRTAHLLLHSTPNWHVTLSPRYGALRAVHEFVQQPRLTRAQLHLAQEELAQHLANWPTYPQLVARSLRYTQHLLATEAGFREVFYQGRQRQRWVQLACELPWAKERLRRGLLHRAVATWEPLFAHALPERPERSDVLRRLPVSAWWVERLPIGGNVLPDDSIVYLRPAELTWQRAAQLQLALRQYALARGRYPAALAELVPDYVPTLPVDPYTSQPFGYRLSTGETLTRRLTSLGSSGPGDKMEPVPAGSAVLWSAGVDGRDENGQASARVWNPHEALLKGGEDWVWWLARQ
jgi:hypothetical protein